MTELEKELEATLEQAKGELLAVDNEAKLEDARIKYLGRKGLLPALMAKLGQVPKEDKPAVGKAVNAMKQQLTALFQETTDRIKATE